MSYRSHSSTTPRTLLVVRPSLAEGGADRVTVTLLRELDRSLFRPSLVLQRIEGPHLEDVPEDVHLLDLGGRRLWTAWLPLLRILRREKPDIVFSTSSGTNVIAALAVRLATRLSSFSGRLVLSERGHLRESQGLKKKLLAVAKKLLYSRADLVTVVSEGVGTELRSRLALPPRKVAVVYSPILDESVDALSHEEVDHPWFEPGIATVLSVGRLVPEKDQATLLRAFARVRRSLEARLVVLGEGPLRRDLESLAQDLGLDLVVDLAGFDKNPFRFMRRCSVFVLPSRTEGLPGALIQAMACGAPVVSTDCPSGPAEIIEPGRSGLLVPVGDEKALGDAIVDLLSDEARRSTLAREGKTAAARFRVEAVIPRYERALLGDKVQTR